MLRGLVVVCMMALSLIFSGCDGRKLPVTDFNKGFNTGIEEVREVRQKWGVLGDVAGRLNALFPGRNDQSEQWNAGYRAGVSEELKR